MCELSSDELWLVIRLYAFALSPVFLGLYYLITQNISYNTAVILCLTFFICAAGFELWLTYGLFDGLPVNQRRSDALNCAIKLISCKLIPVGFYPTYATTMIISVHVPTVISMPVPFS